MTEHRTQRSATLAPERLTERFDMGGKSFEEAFVSVMAGGPDEDDGTVDEWEADK